MVTDNTQTTGTGKMARTYTVGTGSLNNFEDLVSRINTKAREKGVKSVDRGDVVSFLFNLCPNITPEQYFNEPAKKKTSKK